MTETAREINDPDWALELLSASMATSTRVKGTGVDSTHVWQDVVRVLTKAGRLEEAANVLRVSVSRSTLVVMAVAAVVSVLLLHLLMLMLLLLLLLLVVPHTLLLLLLLLLRLFVLVFLSSSSSS